MITTYVALKLGAILLTTLLPFGKSDKKAKRPYIPLSDWAVNEKGLLVDLTEETHGSHPIKLKH